MTSVALSAGPIHLGLDTSKNAILVGILRPDEVSPDTEKIFNDDASIRRLIDRFEDHGQLRVCYEAGPTGFGLYRLLRSIGVACDVVVLTVADLADDAVIRVADERGVERPRPLVAGGALVGLVPGCSAWWWCGSVGAGFGDGDAGGFFVDGGAVSGEC
jgi:transposase